MVGFDDYFWRAVLCPGCPCWLHSHCALECLVNNVSAHGHASLFFRTHSNRVAFVRHDGFLSQGNLSRW